MVMVSPQINPKACWEFESEILVLRHPTTISCKYQAMGMYQKMEIERDRERERGEREVNIGVKSLTKCLFSKMILKPIGMGMSN